jgi:hypothetical protein
MTRSIKGLAAALIAAIALTTSGSPSVAAAFFVWEVTDVSSDDVLMVRAYPNAQSRILVGYPAGVPLSMTGRCTGGIDLGDISGLSGWRQRQIVRNVWSEVWLDPYATGEFRNGWVYGAYIRPI